MIELSNLTTEAQFNKLPRVIYSIISSNGSATYYVTKNSAYSKMENIQKQLENVMCLERVEYNDLDCRPDFLLTEGGAKYELCTHTVEW